MHPRIEPTFVKSYEEFTPDKEDSILPLWDEAFVERLDKFHEHQTDVAKYTFYKDVIARNKDCHFDLKCIKKETPFLLDVDMRNCVSGSPLEFANDTFLKWIISKESPWYPALGTAVIKVDEKGNPLSWLWPNLDDIPCLLVCNFCIAARQINEHRLSSYGTLLKEGATIKEAFYLQYFFDSMLSFGYNDNWHKPFNPSESNSEYFLGSPTDIKSVKDRGVFTPRSNHIWVGKPGFDQENLKEVHKKVGLKGLLDYIRKCVEDSNEKKE